MTLTETKVIDKIEVTENGTVQYREATRIIKNGEQIAQTYHRSSLSPASDLADAPANVAAICKLVWTDEVIQNYKGSQNDNTRT